MNQYTVQSLESYMYEFRSMLVVYDYYGSCLALPVPSPITTLRMQSDHLLQIESESLRRESAQHVGAYHHEYRRGVPHVDPSRWQ